MMEGFDMSRMKLRGPVALLSDIKQVTCIFEVFRQDSRHILIGQESQILPSQNHECAYVILEQMS